MLDTRFYKAYGPIDLSNLIEGLAIDPIEDIFADEEISSASIISGSVPGQICFLDSKRHIHLLEDAKASACFVSAKLANYVGAQNIIPLISKTPKAHFGRVVTKLTSPLPFHHKQNDAIVSKSAHIHASVFLGAGAVIEQDVIIEPYSVIGPGVHIGARTIIGSHTHIECAIIGEDCKVKSNASIGGSGFGTEADEIGIIDIPHIGRVLIGNRVSIGSQSCIDRGQIGDTRIEDDVKIDNLVQIGHNVVVGQATVMAGHVGISGSCRIGKNVRLGGSAGLANHITVGDGASVAAKAGVMNDIPAGEIWSGLPALPIRDHMRIVSATRKLIQKPKA